MAARKKGRNRIEVNGRHFAWWVHQEREVRIASEDQRFVVSCSLLGEPIIVVPGSEFPGIEPSEKRPILLAPPTFDYRNPAGLARQLIAWAYSADRQLKRLVGG